MWLEVNMKPSSPERPILPRSARHPTYRYCGAEPHQSQASCLTPPGFPALSAPSPRVQSHIGCPETKIVVFNASHGYNKRYCTVPDETRAGVLGQLERQFTRTISLGDPNGWIWTRKGTTPGPPRIFRGPYANQ